MCLLLKGNQGDLARENTEREREGGGEMAGFPPLLLLVMRRRICESSLHMHMYLNIIYLGERRENVQKKSGGKILFCVLIRIELLARS